MGKLRKLMNCLSACANKCCPLPHIARALADSTAVEDKKLAGRLAGFSYLYMMIWVSCQAGVFCLLYIMFLLSEKNPYMVEHDCCESVTYLSRSNNDLPYESCPQKSCMLYDFAYDGAPYALGDKRPRQPDDGPFSMMFEYQATTWCCNYHATDEQCCSTLPWGAACGMIMWMTGFASICSMVMTQVILLGVYAFTARRNAWFVFLSAFPAMFVRLCMFEVMFHTFGAFCFLFLHFWYPMIQCDNPHAERTWELGVRYFYHYFESLVWIYTHGFTEWDGYFDMDSFVATHNSMALSIDVFFSLLYAILSKCKDDQHRPYLHLTFFKL